MKTTVISGSVGTAEKAETYKRVFGEAPWNEGFVCRSCESLFPISGGKPSGCPRCGADAVGEYYDTAELSVEFEALAKRE